MQIKVTARHFKATPELREEATETAKGFSKLNDNIISVEVIFAYENSTNSVKSAEFIVHVNDHTLVATDESDDFSKSLALASEKIERQLRKLKTKSSKGLHSELPLEEMDEDIPTEL